MRIWPYLLALFALTAQAGEFKTRYLQLLKKQRDLYQKRINLAENRKDCTALSGDKCAHRPDKKVIDRNLHVLQFYNRRISRVEATDEESVRRHYLSEARPDEVQCKLDDCKNFAKPYEVFRDINRVLEKLPETDPDQALKSLALEEALFSCERHVGSIDQNIVLKSKGIGRCMFAHIQAAKVKGIKLNTNLVNTSGFGLLGIGGSMHTKTGIPFTEKQEAIRKFIMAQPDYRLNPMDLFNKVYTEIHEGDLIKTLYDCYLVLGRGVYDGDQARKLMDIRGDRPRNGNNSGDWYHFFGTMYTSMYLGELNKLLDVFYMIGEDDHKEFEADQAGIDAIRTLKTKLFLGRFLIEQLDVQKECAPEQLFSIEPRREKATDKSTQSFR